MTEPMDYPMQKCANPDWHTQHNYEGAASDLAAATFWCPGNLKERDGDQPLPTVNDSQDIQSMVIADIEARRQVGISRYGTALQAFNGRDVLRDLYEELIDAAMYVKQAMVERDAGV
jgi:hypothetical protein